MPKAPEQLLKDALQLPEDQRAGLVAELLDSLDPAVPSQSRSDQEWIAEVQRRARAALAGQSGLSWDQALTQITDRLAGK